MPLPALAADRRRPPALLIVLTIVVAFVAGRRDANATANVWERLGPFIVRSVAVDPASASTVYVGTHGGRIFVSHDGGLNWTNTGSAEYAGDVRVVAFHGSSQDVYAAGYGGVWRTTDGGQTWAHLTSGMTYNDIYALAIAPSAPLTIYAGDYSHGVYRSSDGGATWATTAIGAMMIRALAVDPLNAATALSGDPYNGVYKTTDGFASARPVYGGGATALAYGSSSLVLMGTRNGLMRSTDGGESWTPTAKTSGWVTSVVFDPSSSSRVYATFRYEGIYVSTDGGVNWAPAGVGASRSTSSVAVAPSNSQTLYLASVTGLFRSTNQAQTWSACARTIDAVNGGAVAVAHATGSVLLGTNIGAGLQVADSNGTWNEGSGVLAEGATALKAVAFDPVNPSNAYAADDFGHGFRSTNGGTSWAVSTIQAGSTVFSLAVDPRSPSTIYAATQNGMYKSSDSGVNWNPANGTSSLGFIFSVVIEPTTSTVYAATRNNGVFRSADGGASWIQLNNGLNTQNFMRSITVCASDPATLYVGTQGYGVFRSSDGGASWTATSGTVGTFVSKVVVNPRDRNHVLAATSSGVYQTLDGGASWQLFSDGLSGTPSDVIFDDVDPSTIYAVSGAVYRLSGVSQHASLVVNGSAKYDTNSSHLSVQAFLRDTLGTTVVSGSVLWTLRDTSHSTIAQGVTTYNAATGRWEDDRLIPVLAPGLYTLSITASTGSFYSGAQDLTVSVGGGTATVSGRVVDAASGAGLGNADIALFDAAQFWSLARAAGGQIPSFADALSKLTPVSGPMKTANDGSFQATSVPWGKSVVIACRLTGYLDGISETIFVSSYTTIGSMTLKMSVVGTRRLSDLLPDVNALYQACEGVLDFNANEIVTLSQRVASDGLYDDPDFWDLSRVASFVSIGATGASGLAKRGARRLTKAALIKSAEAARSALLQQALQDGPTYIADEIRDWALNTSFPRDLAALRASQTYNAYTTSLDQTLQDFITVGSSTSVDSQFDWDRARRLPVDTATSLRGISTGQRIFIVPADPSDPVALLNLRSARTGYEALSEIDRRLKQASNIVAGIEIVGSVVTYVGAAATLVGGAGAPVAVTAAAITNGASWAGYGIDIADVEARTEMGLLFSQAIAATYPQDNSLAVRQLGSVTHLLEHEATSPFYLRKGATFSATMNVDPGLVRLFGQNWMFALGWPVFESLASGDATVTITNTGNSTSTFRTAAYTSWAPLKIGQFQLAQGGVVAGSSQTTTIGSGGTATPHLRFAGHSRSFLQQLKPHYLSVESFSGPWLVAQTAIPFYVLDLGELIPSVLATPRAPASARPSAAAPTTRSVSAAAYSSAAARQQSQLRLRELVALASQSTSIAEGVLTAEAPTLTSTVTVSSPLFAIDLRVFAPESASIAILLTDASGRRLGQSAADGNTYYELPGVVAATSRPATIRLAQPAVGTYNVAVTLLNPSASTVPVSLFREDVAFGDALMTVSPSFVLVDAPAGTSQQINLYISEASGQHPLTNVTATITAFTGPGSPLSVTSPWPGASVVQAGQQSAAAWTLSVDASATPGKYTGSITVNATETGTVTIPVVVLVRRTVTIANDVLGADGKPDLQTRVTLDANGVGQFLLRVPQAGVPLYGAFGIVPLQSVNGLVIDVGGDGTNDLQISGALDVGIMVRDIEAALRTYELAHPAVNGVWDIPVVIRAAAGTAFSVNGAETYLDTDPTPLPATPVGLLATAAPDGTVSVSWYGSSDASSYEVARSTDNQQWTIVGTPTTSFLRDSAVTGWTTYLYKVRAINEQGTSPYSAIDAATTVLFSDDPLQPGVTTVRATHITELRNAVNSVRTAAGLLPMVFTDPILVGTRIRALHIQELRSSLDAARAAIGLAAIHYSNASLAGSVIRAADLSELREGVK